MSLRAASSFWAVLSSLCSGGLLFAAQNPWLFQDDPVVVFWQITFPNLWVVFGKCEDWGALFCYSLLWWSFLKSFWCRPFLRFSLNCYSIAPILCFDFWPEGMWDLISPPRDQTCTAYTGRWGLNHWTTREVPLMVFWCVYLAILLSLIIYFSIILNFHWHERAKEYFLHCIRSPTLRILHHPCPVWGNRGYGHSSLFHRGGRKIWEWEVQLRHPDLSGDFQLLTVALTLFDPVS